MSLTAHLLAVLLAGKPMDYEDTADAIEGLFTHFGDERKADLYALLQDTVRPGMAFGELEQACARALFLNTQRFG